jgi:arginine-tRNA-protein transferase
MTRLERATPLQVFFRTRPKPCPYLPGRFEQQIFGELVGADGQSTYEALSRAGFRRSHRMVYRPSCPTCSACVPVRVVAEEFAPGRTLRRIARANADLVARVLPPIATAEQHWLFSRYLAARHSDSEMLRMTFDDYRSMVQETTIETGLIEFRDRSDGLVAALLADWLSDGLSAVYSFFDPDLLRCGLGNHMVLWLIEQARRDGLPHVYLGYWIAASRRMSYKARFRPIEALGPNGWRRLPEPDRDSDRQPPPNE